MVSQSFLAFGDILELHRKFLELSGSINRVFELEELLDAAQSGTFFFATSQSFLFHHFSPICIFTDCISVTFRETLFLSCLLLELSNFFIIVWMYQYELLFHCELFYVYMVVKHSCWLFWGS